MGTARATAPRFRTYQQGHEHEETTLRERQIWRMRQIATASPDEEHRLAARIVWTEDRRRRLLRELYPDMARNVLEALVREPQTWRKLMVERDQSGIDWAGPE